MSKWLLAAVSAASLLLTSCVDSQRNGDLFSPDGTHSTSLGPSQLDERAALTELTQAVALALQDRGLRQRIRTDMWRSRYTAEHKLHFHAYVQGESGGILLAKMAKHSGKSRTELQQLIASVRPLEFYVPDPDHRAEWTGDEDVVVGSQLEEEDVPVFYTTGGAPLFVGANDFPEQPTLSLVPVESDFSVQLDPNTFENGQDRNGETIGTYQVARGLIANQSGIGDVTLADDCDSPSLIVPCKPIGGGGGGGWTPPADAVYQRGIGVQEYISHIRALNDHEPKLRGAPEFKLLVVGTSDTDGNAELRSEFNIPEGIWAGSDDTKNAKWREYSPNLKLILWDTDYGTRVRVECWEIDGPAAFSFNVSGSTTILGVNVGFSAAFQREDSDDFCGRGYITPRLSTGEWTEIPNNSPRDIDYDGTSDLQWYGYGRDVTT